MRILKKLLSFRLFQSFLNTVKIYPFLPFLLNRVSLFLSTLKITTTENYSITTLSPIFHHFSYFFSTKLNLAWNRGFFFHEKMSLKKIIFLKEFISAQFCDSLLPRIEKKRNCLSYEYIYMYSIFQSKKRDRKKKKKIVIYPSFRDAKYLTRCIHYVFQY